MRFILAVNHALITRSRFIHQTYVPVSLEIKDTVVRAYRTDPVQVRSCLFCYHFNKQGPYFHDCLIHWFQFQQMNTKLSLLSIEL
ncbi:unnamed protein product [Lathyrus oleraceus]